MDIYIKDTGYVNRDITGTAFPDINSATDSQLKDGEFKEPDAILLKVTNFNNGIKKNTQYAHSLYNSTQMYGSSNAEAITFSLTCMFKTSKDYNDVTELEDLPSFKKLLRMTLSKGHKDIYITDDGVTGRDKLLSLRQWMYDFGKTDSGSGTERRHLNVSFDAVSQNESVKSLKLNLNFTLLWNITDRE